MQQGGNDTSTHAGKTHRGPAGRQHRNRLAATLQQPVLGLHWNPAAGDNTALDTCTGSPGSARQQVISQGPSQRQLAANR